MNISSALPSNFANAVAPFSAPGSSAVGEESLEAKNTPFKPVESLASSGKLDSQRKQAEGADEAQGYSDGDETVSSQDTQTSRSSEAAEQAEIERDQAEIQQLAARDREVRSHEQAHASVGGIHAGAPVFQFERGPDGISYAVGGEVSISTSKVSGDPQATIEKAQQIRRAALAPADPSPQDRQVAAYAAQMELEARQELRNLQQAEEAENIESEQVSESENDSTVETVSAAKDNNEKQNSSAANQDEKPRLNNFDLNRRLIDIGAVISSLPPSGSLLDQQA